MGKRAGFTLVELLVVIAIIAVLAAIIFPVFAKARAKAKQATCAAHLKQIAAAVLSYAQDYDEVLPLYTDGNCGPDWRRFWHEQLEPYVKNWGIYRCPQSTSDRPPNGTVAIAGNHVLAYACAYPHVIGCGRRGAGNSLARFANPTDDLLAVDHHYSGDPDDPTETGACCPRVLCPLCSTDRRGAVSNRHNGGANGVFLDGHAKWYPKERYYRGGNDELWGHRDNPYALWGWP